MTPREQFGDYSTPLEKMRLAEQAAASERLYERLCGACAGALIGWLAGIITILAFCL
jgi:hypothetical protein